MGTRAEPVVAEDIIITRFTEQHLDKEVSINMIMMIIFVFIPLCFLPISADLLSWMS